MSKEQKQITREELTNSQQDKWGRLGFYYQEDNSGVVELRWDGLEQDIKLFPFIIFAARNKECNEEFNSCVRTIIERYYKLSSVLSTLDTDKGITNGNTVKILEHILLVIEGLDSQFTGMEQLGFDKEKMDQMSFKVRIAAFFHDEGKTIASKDKIHCEISAQMAQTVLRNCPLTQDNEQFIQDVVWLCRHHHDFEKIAVSGFFKKDRAEYELDESKDKKQAVEDQLQQVIKHYEKEWDNFKSSEDRNKIAQLFSKESQEKFGYDWSELSLERLVLLHQLCKSDVMSNPLYEKYARENDYLLKTILEVIFNLAVTKVKDSSEMETQESEKVIAEVE